MNLFWLDDHERLEAFLLKAVDAAPSSSSSEIQSSFTDSALLLTFSEGCTKWKMQGSPAKKVGTMCKCNTIRPDDMQGLDKNPILSYIDFWWNLS